MRSMNVNPSTIIFTMRVLQNDLMTMFVPEIILHSKYVNRESNAFVPQEHTLLSGEFIIFIMWTLVKCALLGCNIINQMNYIMDAKQYLRNWVQYFLLCKYITLNCSEVVILAACGLIFARSNICHMYYNMPNAYDVRTQCIE